MSSQPQDLQSLLDKLLEAGFIEQLELDERASLSEKTVEIAISEDPGIRRYASDEFSIRNRRIRHQH